MYIIVFGLFFAVRGVPLFAVRVNGLIQILPDGTHRAQQTDGTVVKFRIENGKSTAEILWQLPDPNSNFVTSAGSNADITVAELVHGECRDVDMIVKSVVKVVVGTKHACLLRENGHVMCWGDNSFCQLGPSIPPGVFTTKAIDVFNLETFSMLEVFGTVTCASNADTGVCWGAIHPIKTGCMDRVYRYDVLSNTTLLRLLYAVVMVSENSTIIKSVVGGTMYVGRAAEPGIVNDPSALCVISESMVKCRNIHGFYVGDVFPLLSKPYSEAASLDGPVLFGQPGCGYKLTADGNDLAPADAAVVREYNTSRGCLRILSCANAMPNNTVASNSVIKLVSGDSHLCFLDSAGDVYCRGSNSVCQFISENHKLAAWRKIQVPFKASNLLAHGNVTCVSDQSDVFCTGCISVGCICTHSVTFTQVDVDKIDITDSGVCVGMTCLGVRGKVHVPDPVCTISLHTITCGDIAYAAKAVAFAASRNMVVFTTSDNRMCVSDNGLRSVACD